MTPPGPAAPLLDPPPNPRPRRRWLRLSLRASMIAVLLVGGGMGYLMHRVRVQREAVRIIEEAGGWVRYDYQFSTDPTRLKAIHKVDQPSAPAWLRGWLGDDLFRTVAAVYFFKPTRPEALGAVARLDGLLSLGILDTAGLEGAWPTLAGLPRLEEVFLHGPAVGDQALDRVGRIGSLRVVGLMETSATNSGILALWDLPQLRLLTLQGCTGMTDAGVARMLAGMKPGLERFSWWDAPGPVTQTVRALVDRHPTLRELNLIRSPVEDADLAPIGGLRDLTSLELSLTRVTDVGVAHLGTLVQLENLWIDLPGVTDAGLKAVGRLGKLRFLDLTWSKVGDAGFGELAGLHGLMTLRLGATGLTDAGAATLARLPRLEELIASDTKLTDAGLLALEQAPSLRSLDVADTAVTDGALTRFRSARPAAVATNTYQPMRWRLPTPRK